MSYCFPPELGQIVQQELAAGSYHSEDELLLEAVRLLHQREQDLREFKAQLRGRLDRLDREEGIEIEDEEALRAFFDNVQGHGRRQAVESRNAPSAASRSTVKSTGIWTTSGTLSASREAIRGQPVA